METCNEPITITIDNESLEVRCVLAVDHSPPQHIGRIANQALTGKDILAHNVMVWWMS